MNSSQVSAEVEQACGTNGQCRCDAGITGSMSFAMNTLSASDDFAETQETISKNFHKVLNRKNNYWCCDSQ